MPFNRVLAVVSDDPSDINTISRAADIVRDDHGQLFVVYVIKVERSMLRSKSRWHVANKCCTVPSDWPGSPAVTSIPSCYRRG